MTNSNITAKIPFTVALLVLLTSVGSSQTTASGFFEGNVRAEATLHGSGLSGSGYATPWLFSEAPRLGLPCLMRMKGLTPGSSGVIYAGARAAEPFAITDSVQVYLDVFRPRSLVAIPYIISPAGGFDLPLVLPGDPELAGLSITFQAFGAVGGFVEITNGLSWIIGY